MSTRRLPWSVAPLALAATLVLAPARQAAAQAACATATLSAYLDPTFTCRVGNWLFHDFLYDSFGDASGPEVLALAPPPGVILMTPFTGLDAQGRETFGFEFDGFDAGVAVDQGTTGDEAGAAASFLQFRAVNMLAPAHGLARVELDVSTLAAADTPGRLFMGSSPGGTVTDVDTGIDCFDDGIFEVGPGAKSRSPNASCPPPRPQSIEVFLGVFTFLNRDGPGTRPITGFTSGSVDRITFTAAGAVQAVPEPATVALLAAGLAGVAGVAARRRRAAR